MKKIITYLILAGIVWIGYLVVRDADYTKSNHSRTKRVIHNVKQLPGL